ncbi:MAG: DUF4268 domain-containing protein [Lutispora sp.]|nr:DUF4268 domain-containing protein [Lutispora sp.]
MYLINKTSNRISKIEEKTFSELGLKEREHLQEWLANEPTIFGEDLLIIQKEFDGFSDTKERLDLLALDKEGNLVVIENKLDDSGRDVTWQALKYASYCSSLSKEDIRAIYQDYLTKYNNGEKAEEKLYEFFEKEYDEISLNKGPRQRIILVAAKFRKEVTSTVLWLINYNIRIQCFRVTPYKKDDELFLDIEQIIPMKDAEDYVIKMAEKAQDDIIIENRLKSSDTLRLEFWSILLKEMAKKSDLFKNINPKKDNWINAGSGVSGVPYTFSISKSYARVELYIDTGDKIENKKLFDYLYKNKEYIDMAFGEPLIWERLDDKKASRISSSIDKNSYGRENWDSIIPDLIDRMARFEKTFGGFLKKYKK